MTPKQDFKSYDYKQKTVREEQFSYCMDCYRNFGWMPDENKKGTMERDRRLLWLKRDKQIANKAELTRLERNFEDCLVQVDEMEHSKKQRPMVTALTCGMIGTIFMAGATFAATAATPIIWLCVLLAIPGFLGWILPFFLYRKGVEKQTEKVTPFIAAKCGEIDAICEKGHALL